MKPILIGIIFLFLSLVLNLTFKYQTISEQTLIIVSLQEKNKQLDDSLFYTGYSFAENSNTMDSLYQLGKNDFLRDEY